MKKVEAIIRPERVNAVKDALDEGGFVGLNTTPVTGRGAQKGIVHQGRSGQSLTIDMLPKTKMELVVKDGHKRTIGVRPDEHPGTLILPDLPVRWPGFHGHTNTLS